MLTPNATGILCALGASLVFTLNDVGIKFLSGGYPLHELVLIRALVAVAITLFILVPLEGGYGNLRTRRWRIHLARGVLLVMANMCFFLSLATIPLAEATAIFFVSPLLITAFSVAFLGEQVGPRRWTAVIVGLAGAVIMLRPGTGAFQPAAVLPVMAAIGYAAVHTLTRKIGVSEKASTMAFYIQLTFITVSAVIGLAVGDGRHGDLGGPSIEFLLRAWTWPPADDLLIMAGIGCMSAAGGYLISQAYRLCEAALIAPFEYIALILAVIWGITIFGEWPDWIAWTGTTLILCGGLFVFLREAALDKEVASRRPMPRHR